MESQGRFVFLRDNFTQRLVGYLVREIPVFYDVFLWKAKVLDFLKHDFTVVSLEYKIPVFCRILSYGEPRGKPFSSNTEASHLSQFRWTIFFYLEQKSPTYV